MTRGGREWRLATTTLAVAAVLTGCSTDRPHDVTPDAAAATPRTSASSPAASSSGPARQAPAPGDLATPAGSAGSLSRSSFPTPRELGSGWRYSVDRGDAEEGYVGNGTPALARDPHEVVQTVLPLGCPRHVTLPVPQHALEVDYTYRRTKVIAIRMAFTGATAARTFYGRRRTGLTQCLGLSGGPAVGPLVTRVVPLTPTAALSDRTPASDPWSELAVLAHDEVALVAARTPPGRPPLTRRQARVLARSFQP